jgi:hypothetical protein
VIPLSSRWTVPPGSGRRGAGCTTKFLPPQVFLFTRGYRDHTHPGPSGCFLRSRTHCAPGTPFPLCGKLVKLLYACTSTTQARSLFLFMYTLWIYEVRATLAAPWVLSKALYFWGSVNSLAWRISSSPSSSTREDTGVIGAERRTVGRACNCGLRHGLCYSLR